VDGRERGPERTREVSIVETRDRQFSWHGDALFVGSGQRAGSHVVIACKNGRWRGFKLEQIEGRVSA
jgi:hypothetical protein